MRIWRLTKHPLARWWWRTDRTTFMLIIALMGIGGMMVTTASSGVASDFNVDAFYFVARQLVFLGAAFVCMFVLSFAEPAGVKKLGILLFVLAVAGLVATLLFGVNIKGAQRWLELGGFRVQPSEFLKPGLIVVNAMLLQQAHKLPRLFIFSFLLLVAMAVLILLQPDFGMVMLLALIWGTQVFVAGLPRLYVLLLLSAGPTLLAGGYFLLPHVRSRLERYFDPSSGDSYQVDQAREAFTSGGLLGRGAGEGVVKQHLPDAHTDFIFAVIGEEFGVISCLLLLALYGWLVGHAMWCILRKEDRFTVVAGSGLIVLMALQVLINVSVNLNLIPTTGMTLPFISYGGSATLGMAVAMGFLLALLKRREGHVGRRK